jgi:ankyrin repeat protein
MSRKLVILFLVLLLCFAACKRQSATNSNAAKPNPDVKDPDGFTPLMNAIKNNDNDGAKKAVEKGGNVNARSNSGITPLSTAAGLGNTEMVKYLLEKGADVNARADGNFTPLMQAAMVGQLEICKLLLDAGADPTVKDISNKTAADWAEKNNHKDIATLLRQKTATAQTGGAAPPNKN